VALHEVTINVEEMLCSSEGWVVSVTAIGGFLKGGGAKTQINAMTFRNK
jgi:hypothetical protein